MLVHLLAWAQQNRSAIFGKITDKDDKQPLIGVNVLIKGTSFGASTDIDGKFRINNVPAGAFTIEVSYIGYEKKVYTDFRIEAGKDRELNIVLATTSLTLDQEVVIIGERPLVDIESAKSQSAISSEVIEAAPTRQIQGILNTQIGVVQNPEGVSIRGGRTYETAFLIDGVSASDPLAGTGFGIDLGSNSIDNIEVTTGGGDVQYGDGSAGIVSTKTRSGGDKFEMTFGHRRDNLGFNRNWNSTWGFNTYEATAGGPVKAVKKGKMRLFSSFKAAFDDQYFRTPPNQLTSSLYPNSSLTPSTDNRWAGMLKVNYDINPRKKLALTYLRSMTANQDVNMLRIIGNDVPFLPGYQFNFALQPDNANTYTHTTNLTTINWQHTTSNKFSYSLTGSRLFVRLRADANGRYWRPLQVDSEFEPRSIVTFPNQYFNPNDTVVFVLPGPGLNNNDGIATLWHDHYVVEYGLRFTGNYYYGNNRLTFGYEHKAQEMQWIDINRPWIGAPIQLANGETTQSFRLGDYSDVWKVSPQRGGFYASNRLKYKGLIAEVGARLEYWAPGRFLDNAVNDPVVPIRNEIRTDYLQSTFDAFGYRMKARLLPKVSASFPIRENQMMFFNYAHSMILPHPSFLYAGMNPFFQDRSTLSRLGNPNLNPEVDISYELGVRSQITSNDALNVSAYWKDKYDFITAASVQIPDITGREVTRTIRINSDYARVRGIEVSYIKRIGKWFNGTAAASYSVARGQSSSANEALNAILNTGARQDVRELPLAWDSPLDLKGFATFTINNKAGLFGIKPLNKLSIYVEGIYRTGRRYTPFTFQGIEPVTERPIYERDPDPFSLWSGLGESNWWVDLNVRRWWNTKYMKVEFIVQITNLFNRLNGVVPNPVTGRAYRDGDPVPITWRDPRFLDPRDGRSGGTPPDDPSRFRAPRQIVFGLNLKF